jgi:hypothetical protein
MKRFVRLFVRMIPATVFTAKPSINEQRYALGNEPLTLPKDASMAKAFTERFSPWLIFVCLLLITSCATAPDQTEQHETSTMQAQKPGTSYFTGKFSWLSKCKADESGKTPLDTLSQEYTGNIAIIGDGWVLPHLGGSDLGQIYDLNANGKNAEAQCIQKVRDLAHERSLKTFLTVTIAWDETEVDGWSRQSIIGYEEQAIKNPALLQPIVTKAKAYDGVIADIEVGATDNPDLYTHYCETLKRALGDVPLGIALIHKYTGDNRTSLNGFQDWRALGNIATFAIIMALDQEGDTANQPIVTSKWLEQIYHYAQATLSPKKTMWELAGYCHIWGGNNNKLWNCSFDDVLAIRSKIANKIYTVITENDDATLLNYTDEQGVRYYFADPRPVEMFTALRKLTGQCITGSYYSLEYEDKNHTLSTLLKQAGVFC